MYVEANTLAPVIKQTECGCLGETMTYECTVEGGPGGATVFTGSALNCPSDEVLYLYHGNFSAESGGTNTSCDNGSTVAQSLYVQNNLYISQLNVTVTHDTVGQTIQCGYYRMGDNYTTLSASPMYTGTVY